MAGQLIQQFISNRNIISLRFNKLCKYNQEDYTRNSKGCFLANFKPNRGNYMDDGGMYPVRSDSYSPNDYGLYNMAGMRAIFDQHFAGRGGMRGGQSGDFGQAVTGPIHLPVSGGKLAAHWRNSS